MKKDKNKISDIIERRQFLNAIEKVQKDLEAELEEMKLDYKLSVRCLQQIKEYQIEFNEVQTIIQLEDEIDNLKNELDLLEKEIEALRVASKKFLTES